MPNRRTHTGAAVRFHGCNASLQTAIVGVGKFLSDKKIHLIAAITGKSIDRIGVTQSFQDFGHENQCLFFHIDNAPSVGIFLGFGGSL